MSYEKQLVSYRADFMEEFSHSESQDTLQLLSIRRIDLCTEFRPRINAF